MYLLIPPAGIQEEIRISWLLMYVCNPRFQPLPIPPDFETEGASNAKKIWSYAKKKPTPLSNGSHARPCNLGCKCNTLFRILHCDLFYYFISLLYSYLMTLWWLWLFLSFFSISLYYLITLWRIQRLMKLILQNNNMVTVKLSIL